MLGAMRIMENGSGHRYHCYMAIMIMQMKGGGGYQGE